MKSIFRIYRYINILSLDVAFGAVACAVFFAHFFHINTLPQGLLSMGIAVWIIYTTDHLQDAKRLDQAASTSRHRFHQQHFKALFILVTLACFAEVILIFFLRKAVFYGGLWLGAGVVVYVLVNRFLKYLKEVAGAVLYSCGVLLPVLSLKQQPYLLNEKLMILQFVLIALTNLILFSWMDRDRDRADRNESLVTQMGEVQVKQLLFFLFALVIFLGLFTLSIYPRETILFLIMELVLFVIFRFSGYFGQQERFRLLGDAVFFLPGVALIWQ